MVVPCMLAPSPACSLNHNSASGGIPFPRLRQLGYRSSAGAKAADIAIEGRAVPVAKVAMVAGPDQRIGPRGSSGHGHRRQQPLVQRDAAVDPPGPHPDPEIDVLVG